MDNQHRKISGYRDLSKEEIDLMNEIKAKGVELEALIQKARQHVSDKRLNACASAKDGDPAEQYRLDAAEPERWIALGRTHLQEGFMALVRSVAQPTTFC